MLLIKFKEMERKRRSQSEKIRNFDHLKITPWSRVILEQICATHLVLEYGAFCVKSDIHFCFH